MENSTTELGFDEFAKRYCERQQLEPDELLVKLQDIAKRYRPDGFMLLECQQLDSSRLGSYTILPYGGDSTYRTVPSGPISPRGLASDMSVVVAVLPIGGLPGRAEEAGR